MYKESKKDLHSALVRGEKWAFEEMYKNAFHPVATLVKRNSGTMDDAKDLFQESLIGLIKKMRDPTFKLEVQPKTFVYVIARNLWYNKLRSKKNNKEDLILDEEDSNIQVEQMDDSLMNFELDGLDTSDPIQKLAKEKFAKISEMCQKVITMKYVYGMSHQEIVEETGDSIAYGRIRLYNCMNQLRKYIQKDLAS